MKILNIGSINVDHVYAVEHFVQPGETISSTDYNIFAGGKGFNQSIALARAGATVYHAGSIGNDQKWLLQKLKAENINTDHIKFTETATGHAIIQVDKSGENSIILYGGANRTLLKTDVINAISSFSTDDYLLLQNETNLAGDAIRIGAEHGLKIVFNPAPITQTILDYPLELVNIFILNETEASALTGKTAPDEIRNSMCHQFPDAKTILTMGARGSWYFDCNVLYEQQASPVDAIDTTAAGDTFIGYFLAELMRNNDPVKALAIASRASAICVTKAGAADSIPFICDVNKQ